MPSPQTSITDAAQLSPQLFPLGDAAVVVQFGESISLGTHLAIQALYDHLGQQPFVGLRECVPAFTTLTVYYDPWLVSAQGQHPPYERVCDILQQRLLVAPAAPLATIATVEIPVCYGGDLGPDLAAVARHTGLTPAEVITRHTKPEYLVYMLGFAPGFPYLGGLDTRLATPRRAEPRPLVPAGAVGIAGMQTGIYSLPTPGGWQLIGRTPLRLFDPTAYPPTLLHAGQHLRFVPISEAEFNRLSHEP
ncbi:5-oxoprolinase subunit PxpB [Hymenobacter sp. BT559]|uniref:5-oxoprolinase subunit PxpB n=1 Tax=Hymenobacter sp. BT559 TaxID=2795729 RepID=UPI0018EC3756|nr:5-oxoprolinase subunit PxpB [Hymenobacter sp. BT559]MBJ6142715.1 5-oxoprolinase subunit PxpB [Hymenobacter sp. BT559]